MDKVKKCIDCGTTSETSGFYSGVNSRCKECHKARVKSNRAANLDYYRRKDAERFQKDPRVKARHKKYRKTDACKASMKKSRAKWLEENQDKRAAHVILGNAVRDGKIKKPAECSICGDVPEILDGHHEDYTKPLAVVWCCRKCHNDIHKGETP